MSDKLTDHDYDGIKEFDNPLPNWWLIGFFITILFSALYFLHYQISGYAPNLVQELEADLKKLPQKSSAPDTETEEGFLAVVSGVDKNLGKDVYVGKCAACHGQKGEGLIGPNLTDKFWIHGGGSKVDILNIVKVGVPEKGMPGWAEQLKKEELYAVSDFVGNLKGTNPANAKSPQGVEVK